jgi:hypothetical protein
MWGPPIANYQAKDAMSLSADNDVERAELRSAHTDNAAIGIAPSNCDAKRHAASR